MAGLLSLVLFLCGCLTGVRTLECETGQYSGNDECIMCPRQCSRCISNVICTACKPGFYGYSCKRNCSESCADGICLQENGQCVSCKGGHYFSSNKNCAKCPEHCTYCQSQNICTSCKMGFTGTVCQEKCTNCNPVSGCDIETKICTAGCINGYTGPTCLERCALNCKSCDPYKGGNCRSCVNGRYGSNCDKTCSAKCKDQSCNENNGFCTLGCEIGFWGNQCEKNCSTNCLRGLCFISNGTCYQGCHGNFTGYKCLCPSKCECVLDGTCKKCSNESGFTCDKPCSSVCVGNICSTDNELKCLYGCREGEINSLCSQDKNSTNFDGLSSVIVPVIASLSAFVAVCVVGFVICFLRKRQEEDTAHSMQPESKNLLRGLYDKTKETAVDNSRPTNVCATDENTKGMFKSVVGKVNPRKADRGKSKSRQQKFKDIANQLENKEEEVIREEFSRLPLADSELFCTESEEEENRKELEETGICPYVFNKVLVLGKTGGYHYMNASYIKDYRSEDVDFIACIAPSYEYFGWDFLFWRIVWMQRCSVIVMLNKLRENNLNLLQYWPARDETKQYKYLFVTCIGERANESQGYVLRMFEIKEETGGSFLVKQLQYLGWSEGDAARNVSNLLEFRNIVNEAKQTNSGPIVVHSRKGVGRAGTYIALDLLLQTVDDMDDSEDETDVDIFSCVKHLRGQRVRMVDTVEQYKFLHDALAYYLQSRVNKYVAKNKKKI